MIIECLIGAAVVYIGSKILDSSDESGSAGRRNARIEKDEPYIIDEPYITDEPYVRLLECDLFANRSKNFFLKPSAGIVPKGSVVCVDGSNIIGVDDELRTRSLQAIASALDREGYQCRVFVDQTIFGWLRHKMQDEAGADYLSEAERQGMIVVAPNEAEADGQILQFAEFDKSAHIISNDHYRDYFTMHPWLKAKGHQNRVHGINIVPIGNGKKRILVAGFNMDIVV